MKTWLILATLVATFCYSQGDIKVLREVNISSDDAFRQEIISLRNANTVEEELVIEGTQLLRIFPNDNPDIVYSLETIYVADKGGYRVKYKLRREPSTPVVLKLNPSTLKSLSG